MNDFIKALLTGYAVNWHIKNQAKNIFEAEVDNQIYNKNIVKDAVAEYNRKTKKER